MLLAAPLTVGIMVGGYTSLTFWSDASDWIYPLLQPLSRALMGVWLWRLASAHRASAS
jgi:hypothetical protein